MKQSDRLLHIIFLAQIKTHPACIRQNMMRLRPSCRYDLITYLLRERNSHQLISMNMTDLSPADHILYAAKTMRLNLHIRPACERFCDRRLRAFDTHLDCLLLPSFLHNAPRVCCSRADRTLNSSTNASTCPGSTASTLLMPASIKWTWITRRSFASRSRRTRPSRSRL